MKTYIRGLGDENVSRRVDAQRLTICFAWVAIHVRVKHVRGKLVVNGWIHLQE